MSHVRQLIYSTTHLFDKFVKLSNRWVVEQLGAYLIDSPLDRRPLVRQSTVVRHPLVRQYSCSTPTCSTTHLFDIIFEQVVCRTSGRSFVRQLSCSTDHLFDNKYLMRRKSVGEKATKSRLISYLPENEFLTDKILFLPIYRKYMPNIPKLADFIFVSKYKLFFKLRMNVSLILR